MPSEQSPASSRKGRGKPPIPPEQDLTKLLPAHVWAGRLIGKRIVTQDLQKAAQSREAWSNAERGQLLKPRTFYCSPSEMQFASKPLLEEQTNTDNAAKSSSSLMALPTEIRLQILEDAITPTRNKDDDSLSSRNGWLRTSAVIFTCKQLYAEGRLMAIERHTFKETDLPKWHNLRFPLGNMRTFRETTFMLNLVCDKMSVVRKVYYG